MTRTIPTVTVTPIIEYEVSCPECGVLVKYTQERKNRATEDARLHEDWHKHQASPIFELLEEWEALKRIPSTNFKERTRRAVQLHCQVDNTADATTDPDVVRQLMAINDWILEAVFRIKPKPKETV